MKVIKEIITKAGISIVTVQECKDWVRVTSSDEDAIIQQVIDYLIPFCSDLATTAMNTILNVETWVSFDSTQKTELKLKYLGSTFTNLTATAASGNTITLELNTVSGRVLVAGQTDDDIVLITYTSTTAIPMHFKTPFLQVFADVYEGRTALGQEDNQKVIGKILARFRPYLQGSQMI